MTPRRGKDDDVDSAALLKKEEEASAALFRKDDGASISSRRSKLGLGPGLPPAAPQLFAIAWRSSISWSDSEGTPSSRPELMSEPSSETSSRPVEETCSEERFGSSRTV